MSSFGNADGSLLDEFEPSPLPSVVSAKSPSPNVRKPKWMAPLKLLAGTVIVALASTSVAWGARHYLLSSPRFAVRSILVDGNSRRSAESLSQAAGIALGTNVFSIDAELSKAKLSVDPWIEKATVVRKLPNTVQISVVEREAVALTAIDGDLYVTTRDGELFKKLEGGDPSDLPVLTGISGDMVVRDRLGVALSLKRALDVAEDLSKVGIDKRTPIQEIHLGKDGTLSVTVGAEAIELHFGRPPYREKIEQAARVLSEVARRKANASIVFLDNDAHPERVVVRMR